MKMLRHIKILPALFSAGVFACAGGGTYLGAIQIVDWIESSSLRSVAHRIKMAGYGEWVSIQTDGLQVILEGQAPSEGERFQAVAEAGRAVEPSRVIDALTVKDADALAAPDFSIEILRNENGISVIGLIPAANDKDDIFRRIQRNARGIPVSDFLETASYDPPAGWDDALDYGLSALSHTERSKSSMDVGSVKIEANSASPDEKADLQAKLNRSVPESIVTDINITSPRPVISPFVMRLSKVDGVVKFDACAVDTVVTEQQVLKAAQDIGFQGKANCQHALGVPTAQWATAVATGISALADLETATLSFSDLDVTLTTTADADAAQFDRVASRLMGDLPDIFVLTAILPEKVEIDPEQAPAAFVATLSPEGQVQMQGIAGPALSQATMQAFAQAHFGVQNVTDATTTRTAVTVGWPIRVMASLEALSHLKSGLVDVGEDTITITGRSNREDAQVLISQVFNDKLAAGANFSVDVTYEPDAVPVDTSISPTTCVRTINELIESRKIVFDPGSTNLNVESRDIVQEIAAILKKCPGAPIEVAGHTDSQGREEMNLSLSQARAKAVLVALKFERVRNENLTAKGYGESQPIADNETEEGREANRRIEFRLVDTGASTAPETQTTPTQEVTE